MSFYWLATAAVICMLRIGWPGVESIATVPQRDALRSAIDLPSADVSADGRYVAFESYVRLVPADADDRRDIYVLDRITGRVTLETQAPDSRTDYSQPRISGDGQILVCERSHDADGRPRYDIMAHDRGKGHAWTVTTDSDGTPSNGPSRSPEISDDGRFVTFASSATNLIAIRDDNNAAEDIYVVDLSAPVTSSTVARIRRVNVDDRGVQPLRGNSFAPAISSDGRWVAFTSTAPLDVRVSVQPPGSESIPVSTQVFIRDLEEGSTRQLSLAPGGALPNGSSWSPAMSADGRYVAFVSAASNLVSGDRNRSPDVFLCDRHATSTTLVSRANNHIGANGTSTRPAISGDGRFVAFQSDASNLVCARRCPAQLEDINLLWDVFLFDRTQGSVVRVSEDSRGGWMEPSGGPMLDAAGRVLVFSSRHPAEPSDDGNDFDLFLRVWPPAVPTFTGWPRDARIAPH
jgi:Tol biopolymer transport system component